MRAYAHACANARTPRRGFGVQEARDELTHDAARHETHEIHPSASPSIFHELNGRDASPHSNLAVR
jgi:hypothetical protein